MKINSSLSIRDPIFCWITMLDRIFTLWENPPKRIVRKILRENCHSPPPPSVLLAKIYKSINEPVNHLIHQSINLLIMLSLIRERSFLSMKFSVVSLTLNWEKLNFPWGKCSSLANVRKNVLITNQKINFRSKIPSYDSHQSSKAYVLFRYSNR